MTTMIHLIFWDFIFPSFLFVQIWVEKNKWKNIFDQWKYFIDQMQFKCKSGSFVLIPLVLPNPFAPYQGTDSIHQLNHSGCQCYSFRKWFSFTFGKWFCFNTEYLLKKRMSAKLSVDPKADILLNSRLGFLPISVFQPIFQLIHNYRLNGGFAN